MRITRLYHPEELRCGETTQLEASASSHLIRVLRSKPGTSIILFNGDGYDYVCKTLDSNTKRTSVTIESKLPKNNESNLSITLIQGLSRQDRMDTTIQKSVELGVNKIIPVICQRSNSRMTKDKQAKKLQHWHKVTISACEQSGRSIIPEITEIISLNDLLPSLDQPALKLILDPQAETSLKDITHSQQTVELLIGPEGGLNDDELASLEKNGFESIRFGPRILRTETAGPAAISAIQTLWGDL
jgi:16S rRNA (uracil1498-N3)-methyltransferase